MSDCISRQDAIHAFDNCLGMNRVQAQDILMRLPSVTPTERTGHWIECDGFDGDTYYDCSECGESWATIEGTPWQNGMKYCPNCGAEMLKWWETEWIEKRY